VIGGQADSPAIFRGQFDNIGITSRQCARGYAPPALPRGNHVTDANLLYRHGAARRCDLFASGNAPCPLKIPSLHAQAALEAAVNVDDDPVAENHLAP
jgi:hypothetical protein